MSHGIPADRTLRIPEQDEHPLSDGDNLLGNGPGHSDSEVTSLRALVKQLQERVAFLESTTTTSTSYASAGCQTELAVDVVKRSPSPLRSYPLHDLLPDVVKKEEVKDEAGAALTRPRKRTRVTMDAVVIPKHQTPVRQRRGNAETTAVHVSSPVVHDAEFHADAVYAGQSHEAEGLAAILPEEDDDGAPGVLHDQVPHVKDEPADDAVLVSPELYRHRETVLPDVKIKKDVAVELDEQSVRGRLAAAGVKPFPVTVDRTITDVVVTRDFISQKFGGATQGTFVTIAAKHVRKHGYKRFTCLHLDFNPNAPQLPGEPGLYFTEDTSLDEDANHGLHRVLIRRNKNQWLYVGQYRMAPATSLTRSEWLMQPSKVRSTWVGNILDLPWGQRVRATIILRRENGREPTKEEIDAAGKDKNNKYRNLTQEEIVTAFDKGEQLLGVWTMECVSYDVAFQGRLAREFPPFQKEKMESKKRKASPVELDNEVESLSEQDDGPALDDDQDFAEFVPRGTRSRPRLSL